MKAFKLHSHIGQLGEKIAKKYLVAKGYTILAENYYQSKGLRSGEIDIIAEYKQAIHFIEVKTRVCQQERQLLDPPESSITKKKLQKMQKTAHCFLREGGLGEKETHFDALAISYFVTLKKAKVRHLLDIYY